MSAAYRTGPAVREEENLREHTTARLAQLVANDEGFVFDPCRGDSYLVNQSALTILRALQDGKDDTEILGLLSVRHAATCDEAGRDLHDFRSRLRLFGLA